jgi:hypothetical protein
LLALSVEIVSTPEETGEGMRDEQKIRDLNDRPIYLFIGVQKCPTEVRIGVENRPTLRKPF